MKKCIILFLVFNCLSYSNYSNTFETNTKLKNSIIDGRFSEYIDGFRGTIEGNGSDYKNINFIKIYEIIGDAFYYCIESCGSNKKLIKSISVQEDSNSILIREIRNMIHLNLKTDKSEKVRRKIEMINKKIELYDRFIGDYTIMRFYKSPKQVSCNYSSHFIMYLTNEFNFLLNLDNIENYEIELKKKYDLEKELKILNRLIEYLYKDKNFDKINVGKTADEFTHYDKYKNAQRKVNYENLDLSDINDIVRIYKYDKREIFEYSVYLDLLELNKLIKERE